MAAVVLCVNLLGMLHFDGKILVFLLCLFACKQGQAPENQLVVREDHSSLRAEPSEKSREIAPLRKNDGLKDLGEVGPAESRISVAGELVQSPWVKVQTADNQTGWVLAWAIRPDVGPEEWLLQKRLRCYVGPTLSEQCNVLTKGFLAVETDEQMAKLWSASQHLRDTLVQLLAKRPQNEARLQFDWLNDVLPGFLFQKNTENAAPQLFAEFSVWHQKALKTKGLQDDVYFQTSLETFPPDGIESPFPVWVFQLSETGFASQLGKGQHLAMLQKVAENLREAPLFQTQWMQMKEQLLDDVFQPSVRYWQSQEKILQELEQILDLPPACLNAREREALQIRRKMFEDPTSNGIVLDLRSGVGG